MGDSVLRDTAYRELAIELLRLDGIQIAVGVHGLTVTRGQPIDATEPELGVNDVLAIIRDRDGFEATEFTADLEREEIRVYVTNHSRAVIADGGREVTENERKTCWCDHVDGTCKPCERREAGVPEPGVLL